MNPKGLGSHIQRPVTRDRLFFISPEIKIGRNVTHSRRSSKGKTQGELSHREELNPCDKWLSGTVGCLFHKSQGSVEREKGGGKGGL